MEAAFKSIDTNGDGHLTVDELVNATQTAGKDWLRSRIEYIVALLDKNGDQKLTCTSSSGCWHTLRGHAVQDELQHATEPSEPEAGERGTAFAGCKPPRFGDSVAASP